MRGLFLFVIVGLALFPLSCGQKDPPLVAEKAGMIAIFSDPEGAVIVLNGLETGYVTPDTLDGVSVGPYTVTVDLQGHASCTGPLSVDVVEDQIVSAEFVLLHESIQHVVLGEDFTSTTCDPCYASSLVLDTLTTEFPESFVVIRYHVWWPPPGDDPFYLANIEENTARNDYYDNLFTPHLFLDGAVDAGQDHTVWKALIADRMERTTHIDLDLAHTRDGLQGTAALNILSCSDYSDRNLYVRFAITEDEIQFDAPNEKEIFFQAMRDMLPDAQGERITLPPKVKLHIDRDYTIQSAWNVNHLNLVAFIQDDDTREILQATSISLQ